MSAICGIYYYDDRRISPETGAAMMRKLGINHADAVGTWQDGQVFLGCHIQCITLESHREILPYHDGLSGLTITADAIIDNRTDLFDKLGINYSHREGMPDSTLILLAYRKWGVDCPKYLLGDFAFAIWDENRRELFCVVDPTGTRAFYYYQSAELFVFSTLLKPLFVLPEVTRERNEIWIADFLADPSVKHQLDPELTLYKNVFLLPAGHTLRIWPDGVMKRTYWEAERQPELKLKSDGEYEEAFRQVLGEAVQCRLRCARPVGVMMSGGLDSTSVACMAARKLNETGHRIQAFTSVPIKDYRDWLPASWLADETPYIEAIKEHFENIDANYCRFDDKHSLSDTKQAFAMLEQPYKILENLFWIDGILAAAKERNIGVVLHGSAGNVTISWGYIQPYLQSLFRAGQWCCLFRESWAYARCQRNPLRALLGLYKALMPYKIQKKYDQLKNRSQFINWQYLLSPINRDFAYRTAVQERLERIEKVKLNINKSDSYELRRKFLSPEVFSHMGVISTKLSLKYGVAWRDPTMDKRVIEFCLSVPDNQFARGDKSRFLLRRAMEGILPDKVRLNRTVRGKQSADLTQRLQPCWPQLIAEIKKIGDRESERIYLDILKIREELTKFTTLSDESPDNTSLRMLLRSLIFSRFLKYEESTMG
ncbi:Asparagine synthase (glutamine-hydrolyzing) [Desulfofarcimen acetoxidans DSM 771]|uniref:asparagine synthase (glutamine-hydrolyzing) n=1 Tax=Desulfofarcimen acetoxidans (strain ATCC 49208 / DSM 771 / KCTC 5769 / VKM B-1644 / 5575) TaxID=485916 RepID=C8W5K6_DESAS|nr:asparagine synthase-related protein [Desulfofarcimen acetoxidans]ACV64006.1 Asparagine synthase (glutamine-hydrolyzing) [Desulfofarcimen acetoxidans DSM 771]